MFTAEFKFIALQLSIILNPNVNKAIRCKYLRIYEKSN